MNTSNQPMYSANNSAGTSPSGLPVDKQVLIHNVARQVRNTSYAELDRYRVREDFYSLHSDIVQALHGMQHSKITDFYAFSDTLEEIAQLTTPEDAYLFGRQEGQDGNSYDQGYHAFQLDMKAAIAASGLDKKCDGLFQDLCDALGDTRALLSEFVELYHMVNVEQYHIRRFFDLGYEDKGQVHQKHEKNTKKNLEAIYMEQYSVRKVDEVGRIALHSELREQLGLETGAKVSLTAVASILVMHRTDTGECEVDELGRITVPTELRHKLSWVAGTQVTVYHTDDLLILKTA